MNSSLRKKLYFGVLLGLIIYAGFAFFADMDELLRVGGRFRWGIFPLVLLLAFGNYLVRMFRWHAYLRILNIPLGVRQSAVVFFSGLAMSVTPGKFGELLKAQYIKNINGTPRRHTAPVIIAERLTDLIGVLFLASLGVFRFQYGQVVFFVVLGVILFALIVISSRRFSLWFIRLLGPLPVIGKRVHKLEEAYDNISALCRPWPLFSGTVMSIVAWGCEGLGFYLVLNALPGTDVGLTTALFIYAFAILVGAVSMLPGGLGATEGTMAGLLILVKVNAASSVVATLVARLATLWFAVLIGLVSTGVWYRLLEGGGSGNGEQTGETFS